MVEENLLETKSLRIVSAVVMMNLSPLKREKIRFVMNLTIALIPIYFSIILIGKLPPAFFVAVTLAPIPYLMFSIIPAIMYDKIMGAFQMIVVSPVTASLFVVGIGIAHIIQLIVIEAAVVTLLMLITTSFNFLIFIYALIVAFIGGILVMPLAFLALGYVNDIGKGYQIAQILSLILVYAAPVYYLPCSLPQALQYASLLIPITPIAEIARYLMWQTVAGNPYYGVIDLWLNILLVSAFLTIFSILLTKRPLYQ